MTHLVSCGFAATFSYDAVGNRLTDVTSGASRVAAYGATHNRLLSLTENGAPLRSYAYDGAGNTLTETRPGESFAYSCNARNRLQAVTRNGAAYASYGYNAFAQMTSRSTARASCRPRVRGGMRGPALAGGDRPPRVRMISAPSGEPRARPWAKPHIHDVNQQGDCSPVFWRPR